MAQGNYYPYFAYLRRLVDAVIADADGFNEYVAGNLPYQQRTGKIARKDFNRIEPRFRIESKDRETSIKALEDSVNGRSVPPLETMTIRQYCKYFRIAHEVYESFYRNLPVSKYNQTEQTYGPNELHGVAYYNRMKFAKLMSSTILIVRMISSGLPRIIMENWGFPA